MKVLVAMSGGVDSSVAAARLVDAGHEVVGATMKLWGGPSDTGCCSVADVDDARRVAQQLGIDHHVFNFTADFEESVVTPYVEAHASGHTPNPCIECNRHLKFDRFLERATQLGFGAIATGHHARIDRDAAGRWRLRRGADAAKDQSYVLHMLGQGALARTLLPVGDLTKDMVRAIAAARGLRTATKPDSQDVCFIGRSGGRAAFLGDRIPLHPGVVVDGSGVEVGAVPAVELVTVGQRRHLGLAGGDTRYAVDIDVARGVVVVGGAEELLTREIAVRDTTWAFDPAPAGLRVDMQCSAHGRPVSGTWTGDGVELDDEVRRIAPGQSVVLYDKEVVLGGGIAV